MGVKEGVGMTPVKGQMKGHMSASRRWVMEGFKYCTKALF